MQELYDVRAALLRCTRPFNFSGHPACAAPCGFTRAGLPVGVQIVGPQYGDRACIDFARLLEREFQGFVPPPGY